MNLSEIKNSNIVVAGKKKPVLQKIKAETVQNNLSDALQAVEEWNELSGRTRKAVYSVLAKTYIILFNAKSGDENEKTVLDVINAAAKENYSIQGVSEWWVVGKLSQSTETDIKGFLWESLGNLGNF